MDRPHCICQRCYDEQQASWISQFLMHCPHFRTMARRRSKSDAWTIDRGVTPERARKHIEAAVVRMKEFAERNGLSLDEALAMVQFLFERRKEKGQPP